MLTKEQAAELVGIFSTEVQAIFEFPDYVVVDDIHGKRHQAEYSAKQVQEIEMKRKRVDLSVPPPHMQNKDDESADDGEPVEVDTATLRLLAKAGFTDENKVASATDDELLAIKGIADAKLAIIRQRFGYAQEENNGG